MVVPVNHFIAFSYSVGPVTVKYSSLRVRKYFENATKQKIKATLEHCSSIENQPKIVMIINILITSTVNKQLPERYAL